VKADAAQIARALDAADPACRLFLLYGPDEASSRDLGTRLPRKLGADAERIDLTGSALKGDPALLADEAASISLFGGARYIRVDPAGDEIVDAVEALFEAGSAGNPVLVIAGNLRKDSKLLKLVLASPHGLAYASYQLEGMKADQAAADIARGLHLRLEGDAARRIAAATGADRALMTRELEKLSLYADATAEEPKTVDGAMLDAVGASTDEGDLSTIVEAVMGGQPDKVSSELSLISATEGIGLVRALLRRLAQIAPLRAEVAAGQSIDAVMGSAGRGIFWKDQKIVAGLLARWTPDAIATATQRLAEVERAFKRSGSVGMIAVEEEAITLARVAAAKRRR
jgi:DNA polymerase-3 subunit delta